MSRGTPDSARGVSNFMYEAFTLSGGTSQTLLLLSSLPSRSPYPVMLAQRFGLFRVRSPLLTESNFFLFLRVLRCFSSPGSPPCVMDWRMDGWGLPSRVSPFRYLRVIGYLLLAAAFRSLSRLSSALSAKASTLRSF